MKFSRIAAAAALVTLYSVAGQAATVTVYGDNVSFTYDDSTLYGTGIVVGDSIFFQPTEFRAESLNGEGVVSVSETLNITVEVITEGYLIEGSTLVEAGDYFTSAGDTSVTASGRLQVTSSTQLCDFGILPCTTSEVFDATGLDTVGATTNWNGGTSVDLDDVAGWGSDTEVTMQIQNNLSATTLNVGEQAWIEKKIGAVGLEVSVIPIPAAAWLFGSALGALGWVRRRKDA